LAVVAFKLTHGAAAGEAQAAVQGLFAHSKADFIVHNDLATRAPAGAFPADIYRSDGVVVVHCATREALAEALGQLLTSTFEPN
jgi:hypothetical protein